VYLHIYTTIITTTAGAGTTKNFPFAGISLSFALKYPPNLKGHWGMLGIQKVKVETDKLIDL